MKKFNLVLDAGTTGIKAFIFDQKQHVVSRCYLNLHKKQPRAGWVEQDPREILHTAIETMRAAIRAANINVTEITALGLTNQRETIVAWNKKTGAPVGPAIVWKDCRTQKMCAQMQHALGSYALNLTGLPIDPYFSASKICWLLRNSAPAKSLLAKKQLAVGTIDSWLMYNLLIGRPHLTDLTNASRTLLFDIKKLRWSNVLLHTFNIPAAILPRVKPSVAIFGRLQKNILGASLPLRAVCGDQQASLFAAGNKRGTTKVTFGTGAFVLQHLGKQFALKPNFFTTLTADSTLSIPQFALEAKVTECGDRITAALHQPAKLLTILTDLSQQTAKIIKRLPLTPKKIMIDGGVTQNDQLATLLQKYSRRQIKKQPLYDGTALGVAKLLNYN